MERVNESEKEFRFGDAGPKYLFRGPRIEWGILVLKPGGSLEPTTIKKSKRYSIFWKGKPN